ncbi:hypothetical protein EYF80_005234 [Liparis tanakae]|uniref:Uncharacterized protein n=1 Tax=Liparis tanakae TaxID=230148 RepID=A0A4Z2J3S6_9TELE|nr:hypothetical protein EYF80_005234 [Liparis tanakae]
MNCINYLRTVCAEAAQIIRQSFCWGQTHCWELTSELEGRDLFPVQAGQQQDSCLPYRQETGPGLDAEFKWSINNEKLANNPLKKEVWGVGTEDNTGSVSAIRTERKRYLRAPFDSRYRRRLDAPPTRSSNGHTEPYLHTNSVPTGSTKVGYGTLGSSSPRECGGRHWVSEALHMAGNGQTLAEKCSMSASQKTTNCSTTQTELKGSLNFTHTDGTKGMCEQHEHHWEFKAEKSPRPTRVCLGTHSPALSARSDSGRLTTSPPLAEQVTLLPCRPAPKGSEMKMTDCLSAGRLYWR